MSQSDIAAGIVRLVLTGRGLGDPASQLWTEAPAVMLSFTEPCVGILCACLPVMRPLMVAMTGPITRIISKYSTLSSGSRGPKPSHNTTMSGSTMVTTNHTDPSAIRAGISARMPVGEGPLFTNRVYHGMTSQWPLLDEESAPGAIRVRSDLEQTTTRR